jgi:hypothetical protein
MQGGFGGEDEYTVYDKPLFTAGSQAALFKAPQAGQEGGEGYVSQGEMDKLMDTSRFKPDRGFSGVDQTGPKTPRNAPVQFQKGDVVGAPTQPGDGNSNSNNSNNNDKPDDGGDLLADIDDFLAQAKRPKNN